MADYLLDTNILILHLRGRKDVSTLLTKWSKTGTLFISVVTRTEILAGMHPHQSKRTMALLNSLTTINVDGAIADQAGSQARRRIRSRHHRHPTEIGCGAARSGARR